MSMTVEGFMKMIEDHHIQMIDFKIVDINGQYRHVTIPARQFSEDTLKNGIGFDASNYGYAVVEKSDMVFIPDLDTAMVDPFCQPPTLSVTGNAMIIDHPENRPLDQYPRNIVQAANRYMKETGIADTMIILPEFEFYLFDSVGWEVQPYSISMNLDVNQAPWNSAVEGRGCVVPHQKAYHVAKPLTRLTSAAPRCAWRWKRRGSPSSTIIRKWEPPASLRSNPGWGDDQNGGRYHDDQVHHPQRGHEVRQDGYIDAQACLRGGRERHACAYAAFEGRPAGVLG